ncbi:uncharacterized protein LOC135828397 [Sycon ciliatum]|uniref:uncharacterized protein LOC135828397 n=1 Tax=Sycon ciliatum TaxID=27933 RepID=UPI0031F6F3E3
MSQAYNPFNHSKFVSNYQPWIYDLDGSGLRVALQQRGAFTAANVKELQRRQGKAEHNQEMLNILTPGGVKAYTVLCDAIESMSSFYKSDCDGMRQLLAEPAPDATTLPPSTGVAASPPTSVHAPAPVTATPAEAPAAATVAAAAAVPGTLVPTANLHVDSPLGEMIGSKRVADIEDQRGFVQVLEPFFSKNEKINAGRNAVKRVNARSMNNSCNVLDNFHDRHKGHIDGISAGYGQTNMMCIIYYLMVNQREMTIHDLYVLLKECARQNTTLIETALREAAYN